MTQKCKDVAPRVSRLAIAVAALGAGSLAGHVAAFQVETGSQDWSVRFDNTLRATAGVRMGDRKANISENSSFDESDYKFDRGDFVTKRVDLLTELDVTFQDRYGFRVSAASWYDDAYSDTDVEKSPNSAGTSYQNNKYSGYTKRYYRGPSGEILDAFVFGRFDLGGHYTSVKVGSLTEIWGESLFTATQGISYGQSPTDGLKAATNPGIEAKETFLPLTQIASSMQLTDDLSVGLQYFLEWKPGRLPEGGTYLGASDIIQFGPNVGRQDYLGPDDRIGKNDNNYGLALRWAPEWLDGTLGLYARRFDDKNSWQMLASPTSTRPVYAEDVKLYGISLSKNIGGASVGVDLSYRKDTPLNSNANGNPFTGPVLSPDGEGARGDTLHVVTNAQYVLSQTKFFDSMSLAGELVYSHLDKVTHNPSFYKAKGYSANCPGTDEILSGCATTDYYSIQFSASPAFNQVFPGWNLSTPVSVGYGLKGNPQTLAGGNPEGAGNYRVGLNFTINEQHQLELAWTDYLVKSRRSTGAAGTSTYSLVNGAAYEDRGWLSLMFKTAF
ncbi:hypothetical protein HNR03_000268 [Pseudomonas sp. JAI111]|uniref:DUF1302 domain-containing protein n=1 Tax=Pseudomonas sp. JAI111 TaxID=2735913 RepID=UPI00216A226E|nr:DUF1302 domain-containing protein [Pseudomonas sp. JAI111]MCS3835688.1 hypothetical protein [Pseudomonas sp. JAI111]